MTESPLPPEELRLRNRRNVIVMAVIAMVPVVMAYLVLYVFPNLVPQRTTNKGTLVRPAISMDKLSDNGRVQFPTGKWMLVVPAGIDCDQVCIHALYLARQTNVALGKNANRIERLVLISGNHVSPHFGTLLARDYPKMLVQYLSPGRVDDVLGRFASNQSLNGYIFMVDPRGFIMMYYSPHNSGKDILDDIKHLLGVSG